MTTFSINFIILKIVFRFFGKRVPKQDLDLINSTKIWKRYKCCVNFCTFVQNYEAHLLKSGKNYLFTKVLYRSCLKCRRRMCFIIKFWMWDSEQRKASWNLKVCVKMKCLPKKIVSKKVYNQVQKWCNRDKIRTSIQSESK